MRLSYSRLVDGHRLASRRRGTRFSGGRTHPGHSRDGQSELRAVGVAENIVVMGFHRFRRIFQYGYKQRSTKG